MMFFFHIGEALIFTVLSTLVQGKNNFRIIIMKFTFKPSKRYSKMRKKLYVNYFYQTLKQVNEIVVITALSFILNSNSLLSFSFKF